MDNDEQKLSKEQQDEYNEHMMRGVAFEEIANSKGFEYIKAYYQSQLKNFVNDVFNKESESLEKFEGQRKEILGLKKLITRIDSDIQFLQDERAKTSK